MFEYLRIIWYWLVDVRSPRVEPVTRPRPLRVTNFVYPTVVIDNNHPRHWNREALERSTALDSTRPTGAMAEWLKAVNQVEKQP